VCLVGTSNESIITYCDLFREPEWNFSFVRHRSWLCDTIRMDLKKRITAEEYELETFSSIGSQLLAVQKKELNFREFKNWLSDC
jgi:hypothetical protein